MCWNCVPSVFHALLDSCLAELFHNCFGEFQRNADTKAAPTAFASELCNAFIIVLWFLKLIPATPRTDAFIDVFFRSFSLCGLQPFRERRNCWAVNYLVTVSMHQHAESGRDISIQNPSTTILTKFFAIISWAVKSSGRHVHPTIPQYVESGRAIRVWCQSWHALILSRLTTQCDVKVDISY